jgi:hypothetical protein
MKQDEIDPRFPAAHYGHDLYPADVAKKGKSYPAYEEAPELETPAFAIVRAVLVTLAAIFTLAFLAHAAASVWPVLLASI